MSVEKIRAVRDAVDRAPVIAPKPEAGPTLPDWDGPLPADCPVTPLGIAGTVRFYLDYNRQLIPLEAREHSRLGIQGLFGRRSKELYDHWPRMDKDGNVTGWKPEAVAEALFQACSIKGVWDPFDRVRGTGARRGDDGELVLHCGDTILVFPKGAKAYAHRSECAPGVIGRYVYPGAEPSPQPSPEYAKSADKGGPGGKLLTLLKTWNWRRSEVDAVLLLGWIGAAAIGGALNWRSMVWLTGGAGTGKSTLHELLKLVTVGIRQVSDTSGAGIWQQLKHSTVPIAIDELEAGADNRKQDSVINLARQAASGGKMWRGGQDHKGVEFTVRSAFLFSSILVPPLLSQDRSRLAILELDELGRDAKPPNLDPKEWRQVGLQVMRRMVDGWARFESTLEFYRMSLTQAGHSARGADQFGTLLACADLLLFDGEADSDTTDSWISKLQAADMAETSDAARDQDYCLQHIVSMPVDPFRNGARNVVGHWIARAAGFIDPENAVEGQNALQTFGLKVVTQDGRDFVAVANTHQGLSQLFAGTQWAGKPGTMGGWVQSLRRLPGACQALSDPGPDGKRATKTLYFKGAYSKATLIPLEIAAPDSPDAPQRAPRPIKLPLGADE